MPDGQLLRDRSLPWSGASIRESLHDASFFISSPPLFLSTEYPSKGTCWGYSRYLPTDRRYSVAAWRAPWNPSREHEIWAFKALLIMSNKFMTRVLAAR